MIAYQLEEKVFNDKEKAYGYLKTRYHVLIPNGDMIDLVNPDRLDIGDGYYSSPYQQLLVENKLTEQQHQELLKDLTLYSNECEKLIDEQLSTLRSLHYWRRNQLVAEREEDHAEVEKSNQSIRYQLEQADQLNIPFKLQNKVLHHAEHHQYENFSDMRINEILSASHFDERGNKISKSSIIPKVDKARKSKEYER
ncbi:hypothetical protein EYB33_00590 (plasmid) [Lysinibacillus sphaericus]|uniref:LPD25 domain-containing protein n=1 Tax=Lysinibacillus sphaericus TaxID=1421 RepID=UPI001E493D1E|nr:LPD25 domain-containing protein [Lysinibacillus sphaericus]UDK94882.1 hypothetical protein EYB33_00590 [Lysinibacillus sphaericus]